MIDYVSKFKEQENKIIQQLKAGEEIRHCVDEKSFQGKYYKPEWVVSSFGRVYSLAHKKWLSIPLKEIGAKNKDGEYTQRRHYVCGVIPVHQLVANYFCDKTPIGLYDEKNIEAHHIRAYDSTKSNEENNCAANLCYVQKQYHSQVVNVLQRGTLKMDGEKNEVLQGDEKILELMTELATLPEAEVDVVHKGNDVSEVRVTASFKGTEVEESLTHEEIMGFYEEMQMARIRHELRKEGISSGEK